MKPFPFLPAVLALALTAAGCGGGRVSPRRVEWVVMGTRAALTLRCDRNLHDPMLDAARRTWNRLDGLLSAWDQNSELSRLSAEGCTNWCERVSEEVRPCYAAALEMERDSGGAFNPRLGGKMRELGFSGGAEYSTFDLGAIAKGFAVDRAWEEISELTQGAPPDALIDLGGNLRVLGGEWRTGVRNPFGGDPVCVVTLHPGEAVATSGNYERFVEIDGVRVSHILDGRTGEPVSGTAGVTVVAPLATTADALSTALFVLGPEEGVKLLERRGELDSVSAIWIPDDPQHPRLIATPAAVPRLENATWTVVAVGDVRTRLPPSPPSGQTP